MIQPGNTLLRHAVCASQIAAVGDREPKVIDPALIGIFKRQGHPSISPSTKSLPFTSIPHWLARLQQSHEALTKQRKALLDLIVAHRDGERLLAPHNYRQLPGSGHSRIQQVPL